MQKQKFSVLTVTESGASKLGGIPATYSGAQTCPPACPLQGSGCYAEGGNVAMHWREVTAGTRGGTLSEATQFVGSTKAQIGRWNIAGDLPGADDRLDRAQVMAIAWAAVTSATQWFSFTHYPMCSSDVRATDDPVKRRAIARHNRAVIRAAVAAGFAVNVSANSPTHARQLARLGFDVAAVAPIDWRGTRADGDGNALVQCPATIKGRTSTCASCGMCARSGRINARGGRVIPMFPAHGMRSRKADKIANG